MTTTSFHPFPRLPSELRAHIWSFAAAPRIVHIHAKTTGFVSPVPPPGVVQVSKESRRHACYQEAFFTATNSGSETRYIWVNFETDMICIEDHRVERLAPHQADIQRLRFTVTAYYDELIYEYFFHRSHVMMGQFTALQELHIVIEDSVMRWGTTFEHCFYGCPKENVRFLDPKSGLLLNGLQLEMVYRWGIERGGMVQDMDDFDEEMTFMMENELGLKLHELREIE